MKIGDTLTDQAGNTWKVSATITNEHGIERYVIAPVLSGAATSSPVVKVAEVKTETADDEPEVKRFKKPTLDEVREQMEQRGMDSETAIVQAAAFCDHHESKGWMIGKAKMKSWKAAVSTWLRNYNERLNNRQVFMGAARNTVAPTYKNL